MHRNSVCPLLNSASSYSSSRLAKLYDNTDITNVAAIFDVV